MVKMVGLRYTCVKVYTYFYIHICRYGMVGLRGGRGGRARREDHDEDEDDDEEIKLHRKDMERDNSFLINHDGDIALPCNEQDDDYTEDRYPQENTDDLPTWRVSYPPRWVSVK